MKINISKVKVSETMESAYLLLGAFDAMNYPVIPCFTQSAENNKDLMEPKTNCGLAHILGILVMNSYHT